MYYTIKKMYPSNYTNLVNLIYFNGCKAQIALNDTLRWYLDFNKLHLGFMILIIMIITLSNNSSVYMG